MAEEKKAMENNNQNQEQETMNQAQQATGSANLNPENMQKKQSDPVMVPMDPRLHKALWITKKVLKVAVPVAAVTGAVFLGINLGGSQERKKAKGREASLNGEIADLQRQLAERPLPALPEITPPAVDIPTPELTHGAF